MANVRALLMKEEEDAEREDFGEEGEMVAMRPQKDFSPTLLLWKQLRALLLKDLTLQSRAIGTNVCQLLTPVIFISFAGVMQLILNIIIRQHGTSVPGTTPLYIPMDISRSVACVKNGDGCNNPEIIYPEIIYPEIIEFNGTSITNCHDNFLNVFVEFPGLLNLLGQFNVSEFDEMLFNISYYSSLARPQDLLYSLPMFYMGKSEEVDLDMGELTFDGNRIGFIGGTVPDIWRYNFSTNFTIDPKWPPERNHSYGYNNSHGPFLTVPFFLPISSVSELNSKLGKVIKVYDDNVKSSSDYSDNYDRMYMITPLSHDQLKYGLEAVKQATDDESSAMFEKIKPSGGIFINSFTTSAGVSMDYTIVANDLTLAFLNNPGLEFLSIAFDTHQRNNIINMISNALFKNLTGLNQTARGAIQTYIFPLPTNPTNLALDISIILGGLLYPFATSFLLPVYISTLVKDKSERHLIMMEQNGMSRWTYWIVTYTFNYSLYVIVIIAVSLTSLAFRMRLFTQTSPLVLSLSFFLWGHAQVALGFFFSNFFSRPRTATIIGYLFVIAGVAVALLLEALKIFPDDQTPFPVYMFYPPFAFYRILYYMINSCIQYSCYTNSILNPANGLNLVTTAMLYVGLDAVAILLLSVYLSFVLPTDYGVRKSPFFPIIAVFKAGRKAVHWLSSLCGFQLVGDNNQMSSADQSPVSNEGTDEDVLAEERSIQSGVLSEAPVVIYQLRKEYPGSHGNAPHIAVDTVSFAVERNECFGLLGPNGAGKTSLISVLTGLYEPTNGTAVIAGYDITTQINSIHRHLGVCPQFDVHHGDLTSEEHLLFYARLKGVRWRREKEVVERALRQVNLFDARKRKSKALSGGMRRRLSIAMAIIGQPDILILDEPTTGLDPASRRQVWEVLEKVKEGRSVILTTHAMEEADRLCTRIGIMNYGRLRCLGTQTHLKARFGSGYQLLFHCESGRSLEVEKFVQTKLPRAVHMETYADLVSFKLERDALVVSQLFQLFNSAKSSVGILDWGIKMTTLEDVFLNIVRGHREPPPSHSSLCPSWLPCKCSSLAKN